MKLEEIVGYLPHKLIVYKPNGIDVAEIVGIRIMNNGRIKIHFLDYVAGYDTSYIANFKPILHPLTDLTKPITVDGKEFVPMNEFDSYEQLMLKKVLEGTNHIYNMLYKTIKKLYQWHFDIHGLIEKGEAIDINTIKGD